VTFVACVVALSAVAFSAAAKASEPLPPSPYDILRSRDLETPVLDAVAYCVPERLDPAVDPVLEQADVGEWRAAREILEDWARGLDRPGDALIVLDGVLVARLADDRREWLAAEDRLRELVGRESLAPQELCLRMELARVLMLLSRESEAAAQWTLAERVLEEREAPERRRDEIAFGRAEILYRTGKPFDAHLAFRKLSKSKSPRIAAASRLRLTDLSFDSGKIEHVSVEYEALLPRVAAFGGSTAGWALRAAEAALDVGELERSLRWIEHFLDESDSRDARDAAEIRLADLDVAFDDALRARKRLSSLSGRRRGDEIGTLASTRAIDLGISQGSPEQRIEVLLRAVRDQRRGVRRYALGVLMGELAHGGDLEGALSVATRLAYEGVDPVVTPNYRSELDVLLARATAGELDEETCHDVIRALGGRYGILIERASKIDPFVSVGECFERVELPWLATAVYRTVTRRFGALGAQSVALPLARSSLSSGEVALARRVAEASLSDPGPEEDFWRAVLAEADFIESRFEEAAKGLRVVLDSPRLAPHRGKLARLLALTIEPPDRSRDAAFLAQRLPSWLEDSGLAPGARAAMVEAALLAAHAQRQAGWERAARDLYRVVDRHAAAGPLRSSARFWLGLAGGTKSTGESVWGANPEVELGSPWGRLAQFERRFEPLSKSYLQGRR
jgi:hypothetical protein